MMPADLGTVLVTGGGGFLGTALIKLLVQRGLAVRSLARRHYPHLARAAGRTDPGRHRRPAGRRPRGRGLPDRLPHRGQGGHLGLGPRLRADQRQGYAQRDRGLPGPWHRGASSTAARPAWCSTAWIWKAPTSRFPTRHDSRPPIPRPRPAPSRSFLGANSESLATISIRPHLIWGPGRQQPAAADPRPGPARTASAHRPAQPVDRSDLYRQRRRSPPPGRRSARARFAHRRPDLFRHPGRNDPPLGHDQPLPQGRRPGTGQALGFAPAGVRRRRTAGADLRPVAPKSKNPR